MGRENFMIKLTAPAGTPEYLMVSAITRIEAMPAGKPDKDGKITAPITRIHMYGSDAPITVMETVEAIEQKCKSIANLLYVVKQ